MRAGCKKVKLTLVLHLEEEVPEDWDEEAARFFIEENHCMDNYIDALHREHEAKPGYCNTCHRGNAYLGHIPFKTLESAKTAAEVGANPWSDT